MNVLMDNSLQHFYRSYKKTFIFIKKKIECGDEDGAGIPEPVENGDVVHFLIIVGHE